MTEKNKDLESTAAIDEKIENVTDEKLNDVSGGNHQKLPYIQKEIKNQAEKLIKNQPDRQMCRPTLPSSDQWMGLRSPDKVLFR